MSSSTSLLRLPKELLDFVTDDLGYASILALRLTCKHLHATISPLTVGTKARLCDETTSTMSDLLKIERWPFYDSAAQRGMLSKQAISGLDFFACSICLKIRSARDFSNAMMKARRGKQSQYTSERASRFCIPCGIKTGKYLRGTNMRYGGSPHAGGGQGFVCYACGCFRDVPREWSDATMKECETCLKKENGHVLGPLLHL